MASTDTVKSRNNLTYRKKKKTSLAQLMYFQLPKSYLKWIFGTCQTCGYTVRVLYESVYKYNYLIISIPAANDLKSETGRLGKQQISKTVALFLKRSDKNYVYILAEDNKVRVFLWVKARM